MKNILAVATLIAAGTALANADTVITVSDLGKSAVQSAIKYDVSGTAGTFSGTGLFTTVNSRYTAGITVNLNLTALGITSSSSTLADSTQLIGYRTAAATSSSEIGLAAISSGVQFTWGGSAYSAGNYVSWGTLWDKKYDVGGNSYVTMTLVSAATASNANGTALYDDTGTAFKANNGSDYKFASLTGTGTYSVITLSDTSKLSGASVFSGLPTAAQIATVSQSIHVVPEPSAFGLLAGVGALALVAARRRRRAK